jgi:maltooligosyltrehalose trehalohydrolase
MMVLLDVVYNHFGPDGNYLPSYAKAFFDEDRHTPWGPAIAFSRPAVARYFIDNALYWLETFRLDGLRFDAVHAIGDTAFLDAMATEDPRADHRSACSPGAGERSQRRRPPVSRL